MAFRFATCALHLPKLRRDRIFPVLHIRPCSAELLMNWTVPLKFFHLNSACVMSLAPTNDLGNCEKTIPGSSLGTFKRYDRCRPVYQMRKFPANQRIKSFGNVSRAP